MKKYVIGAAAVVILSLGLAGCGKVGFNGALDHMVGNWAQVTLPDGCKPKMIAGEEGNGVIVYCEDGRLFH